VRNTIVILYFNYETPSLNSPIMPAYHITNISPIKLSIPNIQIFTCVFEKHQIMAVHEF